MNELVSRVERTQTASDQATTQGKQLVDDSKNLSAGTIATLPKPPGDEQRGATTATDDVVIDLSLDRRVGERTAEVHLPPRRRRLRKRSFDLAVAIPAVVASLPVVVVIALLIKATSKGPVIYRQTRLSRGGEEFGCLKFRTMRHDADQILADLINNDESFRAEWVHRQKVSTDPRVTRIGRFLRKSSLDELPQFINVIRGEMSVVGPRPITEEEVARYGSALPLVHAVKPGITGHWQVNGRSTTCYDERVQLDLDYVGNHSLQRDISICTKTAALMLQPSTSGAQ